jgi:N-carbamoylputrescine amidase
LNVALITEVFFDDLDGDELRAVLSEARELGADVAVLPELPLNAWSPYSKVARDEDAEAPDGPRQQRMCEAAATAGISLIGGAIVRDPESGTRHNTALLYGADGTCHARYRKVHLPEEEGYWETSHYEPGTDAPRVVCDAFALPVGLQICSDVNRPQGFQLLAAGGAQVVFVPRATPPETYDRWRLILRANAIMSGCYVISANRPRSEHGASIGGPSLAIDPSGEVLLETTDKVALVRIEAAAADAAKTMYPGYLKRFPALYAKGWADLLP